MYGPRPKFAPLDAASWATFRGGSRGLGRPHRSALSEPRISPITCGQGAARARLIFSLFAQPPFDMEFLWRSLVASRFDEASLVLEDAMFGNALGASVGLRALRFEMVFRRRSPSEVAASALRLLFVAVTVGLFVGWLTSANTGRRANGETDCKSFGRGGARCIGRLAAA